ncbi:uncharacterized protein LOC128051711 [Budorcas taxicolor]|uniref:uncharacterized protein LOC128051711 n=1 Tax=Budorcas taxicolor TaxID=37181 RepID=UPI0022842563|nr:uncharacterized protein LOC128051711 [Budorcas taxicolor]
MGQKKSAESRAHLQGRRIEEEEHGRNPSNQDQKYVLFEAELQPPRLTRGDRGGSGSAAFTPAEEAPAAPWSPVPLPLPLARLLATRSLPLANFRVLRSTRNRGDRQQVFSVQGTNGASGAREEGGAQTRNREPSAAGTAPKGRGDLRTSQDISRLGKSPPPPFLRGEYTQKVHVMAWRGIRARRRPAAHPAPTLTRGAGHGSRGSLAGRLSSLGRAREGYVSS